MHRILLVTTILFFLSLPFIAFADCAPEGYNIVYVNGILTSQADANADLGALQQLIGSTFNSQPLAIHLGYNPSHLDGYGDELQSVSQALGSPISDYDLDTILDQIAPSVETRKLLLVGHSQGTFYTNEMYDYLVKNGVPSASIAVYNLATPASAVEGGGTYLTSGNDKLVNQVRVWDAEAGVPGPLPANILIPPQPGDDADIYGGHHLAGDYLAGAASRIVSDIDASLAKLTSTTSSDVCFKAPSLGLAYDVQKAAFSLADPTVAGVDSVAGKAASAAESALSAIASADSALTQVVNAGIADAVFSVFPKPDAQNAGTVFSVEKALYGSSLSEADYEALLNGQDLPEDEPAQHPAAVQDQKKSEVPPTPAPAETVDIPPPEKPTPAATPSTPLIPSTSQPLQLAQPISPGFGGGIASAATVQPSTSESSENDATSSGSDEQPPDEEQTQNDTSDASSSDEMATSTASTTPDVTSPPQPAAQTCGQSALSTTGDFFSSGKDEAEYSAAGFLEYHFENAGDGRFTLTWNYFDDQCDTSGPIDPHNPLSLTLPSGIRDWSVRFTSMTHFDVWDDTDGTIIGSYDIPAQLPVYTSIAFDGGNLDSSDDRSLFVSRGLKIFAAGEPPSFTNSVPIPSGCPGVAATGYLFDPSYQNAEYVDGLLRVHLRLLPPYNDGRLFRATMLAVGSDCSFPDFSFFQSDFPKTSLTPFIRYFSFRMASSTHWILWNDEGDVQIQCGIGCEGDVPADTSYVSFYAIVDDFTLNSSAVRTTPYPPTGP